MAITLSITADSGLNISEENLPESRTLTVTAIDSDDSLALFNYSWILMDKPTGSTAVLSSETGASTTIQADVWGTYRIFCIAENQSTGGTSAVDPLRAPLECFYNVSVESENYDLEKPAKGQRNWHPQYRHLVDVVEDMSASARPATYTQGGTLEVATPKDIAQVLGVADSSSGQHYLAVTTEDLFSSLHPTVNGAIPTAADNALRNRIKEIALEQINYSSVTELADVNTADYTLTDGQILVWSSTATDDSGAEQTGAWIPQTLAEAQGDDGLFGVDLCSGETLNDGDLIFYEDDCTGGGPVQIPGWHARNRTHSTFAPRFPYASPGKTSAWHTIAEAAGQTWDDNTAHPGQVAIADNYEIARGFGYDSLVYTSTALSSSLAYGLLPSLVMTPSKFISSVLSGSEQGINYAIEGTGSDGLRDVFYDSLYHTAAEQSTLQAAVTAGQYSALRSNLMMSGLSTFIRSRVNRTGITQLSDVDTVSSTPLDGQVLTWDSAHTDDQGGTGAWVPTTLSLNTGDITGVIAGNYLTGGGLSGDVTLNVADIDVNAFAANSIQLSSEAFSDNDTSIMTSAAILDLIQANAGSGSSSVGDARDIQLADGSGGFIAANWQVSTGDDLIPVTTNAFDLGTSTNRVRKIYAYDGQFYDDVRVDGDLTVVGQQIMQDYAFINDDGTQGTLLFTAGDNSAGVSGSIRNNADNVIIESTSSGSEASLEFKAGAGAIATQKILSNSGKLSNNNSIKLPAMSTAPSVGDFLRTTVVSGRDVEVEFEEVKERVIYSTHVSREVTEEASFSSGNMVFSGDQQACMYWFKNNTGQTLTLKSTHIHVGEMKNLSLSFSLCKATSDTNALNNTWTQVGSIFTITNSSGTDNVIGQAQTTSFTTTTLNSGEYLGIACTDIPVLNRDDRRIVITFECEKPFA